VFGKLSNVAVAQLRDVIREEIRTELDRLMSPTFRETITRGQQDMERIFDAVLRFQSDLDDVRARLKFCERLQNPQPT
jgi:hypothetical protein